MNLLDVFLLGIIAAATYGGWQMGVASRVLSWVGLLGGLFVALRLLPDVLEPIQAAGDSWVLIAGFALLIGGAFCGQAIGLMLSGRIGPSMPGWMTPADRLAGAVIGFSGALLFAWICLPALGAVDSWPQRQHESSAVVGVIDAALPEPPASARAFRRLVRADSLPDGLEPIASSPDAAGPPGVLPLDQATVDRVTPSIVRVESRACGRVQDGSGFVVEPGLIVTNAHVVAGPGDKLVVDATGRAHDAVVVTFDPVSDLALVSVPDIAAPALPVGSAGDGDVGAVFGYPGGGHLRVSPFRIVEVVRANGRDLYDTQDTQRRVFFVATDLEAGDSGAAMVDEDGEVVGIAFAVDPENTETAFALHADELEALLVDADTSAAVDTMDCV